jgi:hypothetical protein
MGGLKNPVSASCRHENGTAVGVTVGVGVMLGSGVAVAVGVGVTVGVTPQGVMWVAT